jgi:ABC-2 type transport system permease protein
MVTGGSKRKRDLLLLANITILVVLLNQIASMYFFRIDLTEEKRYTIKPQTIELLRSLDDEVFIEVFLAGDLNPGFKRFQKSISEILDEFRVYAGGKIRFVFTDPTAADSKKAQNAYITELINRGLTPLNIVEKKDGQRSEKIVIPGALVSYGGFETPVNLLKNSSAQGSQSALNQSIETMEYELASAIARLAVTDRKKIGWIKGHGEADTTALATKKLIRDQYDLIEIDLNLVSEIPKADLIIVARPTQPWSLTDKYKLDQFIMNGGRVMFFMENLQVDMSQVSHQDYYAVPVNHGLDDLFFRYGIRINPDLVQDAVALPYPVVTGTAGGRSQITPLEWPFLPLVSNYADHPATRNLDATLFRFASSMDTIKSVGVSKKIIVNTSPYARLITSPVRVSTADMREQPKPELFNKGPVALGVLLEGTFTSLFKNRFKPDGASAGEIKTKSTPSRVVIFSDADLILNAFDPKTGKAFPVGYDVFTGQIFANRDLLMNLLAFMTDDGGIINARSRKVEVRLLDKNKIHEERGKWQLVNLGLPVAAIILLGLLLHWNRRRKFASH